MRTIKFRGKSIVDIGNVKKDDWVYGGIVLDAERVWIDMPYYRVIVNPDTVGQFTGLYDKNGKEIYEEDIVRIYAEEGYILNSHQSIRDYIEDTRYLADCITNQMALEVIGNIYDSKDLLEETY